MGLPGRRGQGDTGAPTRTRDDLAESPGDRHPPDPRPWLIAATCCGAIAAWSQTARLNATSGRDPLPDESELGVRREVTRVALGMKTRTWRRRSRQENSRHGLATPVSADTGRKGKDSRTITAFHATPSSPEAIMGVSALPHPRRESPDAPGARRKTPHQQCAPAQSSTQQARGGDQLAQQ